MKKYTPEFSGVFCFCRCYRYRPILFVLVRADGDGDFSVGAFGSDKFIAGTRGDDFGIGTYPRRGVRIHKAEEIILYRRGVHRGIGIVPARYPGSLR